MLFILYAGFIPLALVDAHRQSVPRWLCDGWFAIIVLWTIRTTPTRLIYAMLLIVWLTIFARLTRGLGSADVIVIAATACAGGLSVALWTILCACGSGIVWSHLRGSTRLAFIPHLLIGSLMAFIGQQLAG